VLADFGLIFNQRCQHVESSATVFRQQISFYGIKNALDTPRPFRALPMSNIVVTFASP
jgi:hypothetical protein